MVQFEEKKIRYKTLDELGMRPKMQEQLKELLAAPKGFLLFSSMPANGLRSSMGVILHCTDRFTREFAALEEENNRYEPVENVAVTTYSAAQGQTPADVLIKLFRMEPNVVVVRDLVNAQTVSMLCREIVEDRLMIGTIRAKDCADALLRVLAMDVPPPGIRPRGFRRAVPAAGPQIVRVLQGGLRTRPANSPAVGHSRGPHPRFLPAATAGKRQPQGYLR